MTSTTDAAQHPDVSEISDLAEGLLSPTRSAAVRRHLDGCPLCADVRTSLEEIRGLLGTLPGPPRMPAEIAGRIDAALAAEALLHATAPEGEPAVSRETARVTEAPRQASAPSTAPGRPSGRPRAATGPGRPTPSRRRRIGLVATLGAAFGAVILGTGIFLAQGGGVPTAGQAEESRRADAAASAGLTPFSGTPVEERVRSLLTEGETARSPQGIGPETLSEGTTPAPRRALPVPACVLAGTGRTDGVLAQEKGEYAGSPAYLLVLTDHADSGRVQAYVLDASCADRSPGATGDPAKVLFTRFLPRS
ncbi:MULTISPECIES: anti-sigma factor [unclassified Streptomyces]|uniref:zf-HC2 domain-containing protein n=1 Tax=unclassified Streptomyces TaxID=2593676 RepID=UPI003698DDDE